MVNRTLFLNMQGLQYCKDSIVVINSDLLAYKSTKKEKSKILLQDSTSRAFHVL
jgi:hypothetical protein